MHLSVELWILRVCMLLKGVVNKMLQKTIFVLYNSYFFQALEWEFDHKQHYSEGLLLHGTFRTHWIEQCNWKRNQLKYKAQHETDSALNPNKPNFFLFEREGIYL